MSGPTTPTPPPTGATPDQSMEDILASIRRILNEEESAAAQPRGAQDAPQAASPSPEGTDTGPLVLTEAMMVEPGPAAPVPEAMPAVPAAMPAAAEPAATPSPDALLAPAVAAAAAASVGRLLQAVSTERGATVTRSGPSIEDVVREELRPLLKDWLDLHLPGIVERLVRAEIERVVGRALG